MNKTQAGRLLTLAHYLKTDVPSHLFNLNDWVNVDQLDMADVEATGTMDEILALAGKAGCRTSACALGWATNIWPKVFCLVNGFLCDATGWRIVHVAEPEVLDFFGLSYSEAEFLFSYEYDRTAAEEAREIELVVERHGWIYADEESQDAEKVEDQQSPRGEPAVKEGLCHRQSILRGHSLAAT